MNAQMEKMTIEFNLNQLVELYKSNFNLRLELTTNIDNKPVARLYKATPKAKYSQEKQIFGFYFQSEDRRVEFLSDDYGKRFANKQADENYKKDKKAKNEHDKVLSKVEADDLVKYGLIPELIGRLHMVATLNEITEDNMVHILTEPKNALIKQYIKLFAMDDVKLEFEKDALKELAKLAIIRKTGARGLRSILEDIMLDIMFDLPKYKNKTITISKEVVLKTKEPKVA